MMEKDFYLLQWFALLVLIHSAISYDIDIGGNSCGRSYDLEDYPEITVKYSGATLIGDCSIEIEKDSEFSRMCYKPESLNINDCDVKIEVHKGYVSENFPDQVFTCNSDYNTDEDCTYLDSITFRMKNLHGYNQDYQHDIKFRIYSKDSEFDTIGIAASAVTGIYVTVAVVIGVIVFLVILVVIVICCCCKRRAGSGTVYRNQQPVPQVPQGTYPQVQYQTVSPQAAGYQPPPPQGQQPPPMQGYQPPPPQGYQPSPQGYQPSPQGYQPPPQGYQPPPPGGYPAPLQGYTPPPPAQGYQPAEKQKMPSAPPPPEKDPMAPPPYPGI